MENKSSDHHLVLLVEATLPDELETRVLPFPQYAHKTQDFAKWYRTERSRYLFLAEMWNTRTVSHSAVFDFIRETVKNKEEAQKLLTRLPDDYPIPPVT